MIKNILLVTILGLIAFGCKPLSNSKYNDRENPESVTEESVAELMDFLSSDLLMGRDSGTKGLEEAANYIEHVFSKSGVKPYFETYKDSLSNFKNAFNVVGVVEGSDPELKNEFIVLGAHYDHVGIIDAIEKDSIANGANDNASGTTAVIELAEYFGKTKENKRSLIFALFAAEEKGLLGSKHLAPKLKEKGINLYAMVNFEMIGVPMSKGYTAYLTGYEASNMAAKMNEYSGDENLVGFLPQAKEFNLFKRSDNYPFYEVFKVPSQTLCTFDFTNYDFYHHVDDEMSEIDIPHMTSFIKQMIPVITQMANTKKKEVYFYE
ncbi:M28 family metallopeptidase [Zhouia amylolytica]|uniref:Peptidase M28 n=1 Tax=Zhouia amylolytica AD3 TaxID=1286632 RepID=W2UR17_9FLAO|nr:M28 family peptidase [Zhouia amylolytica]ETN96610.1 peptidase M28 [Zhouia amylolytica AD3]